MPCLLTLCQRLLKTGSRTPWRPVTETLERGTYDTRKQISLRRSVCWATSQPTRSSKACKLQCLGICSFALSRARLRLREVDREQRALHGGARRRDRFLRWWQGDESSERLMDQRR